MSSNPSVLVQTAGGTVKTVNASSPAEIAEELAFDLNGTTITVNGEKVQPNAVLRANDFVLFATSKVTSGS